METDDFHVSKAGLYTKPNIQNKNAKRKQNLKTLLIQGNFFVIIYYIFYDTMSKIILHGHKDTN